MNKEEREEAGGEGKNRRVKDKGVQYYSTYLIALRILENTYSFNKTETTNKNLIIPLGPQLYFNLQKYAYLFTIKC